MKEQEALLMAKYGGMKPKKKPGVATKVSNSGADGTVFASALLQRCVFIVYGLLRSTRSSTQLTGP